MIEMEDMYVADVFSEIDDSEVPVKRRGKKRGPKGPRRGKGSKDPSKPKKLTKEVQAMQDRYDYYSSKESTAKEWQDFFESIEKFIMKKAYVLNFKRYVEKDSDLWGHLIVCLWERLVPKKNYDGTLSCWYFDLRNKRLKPGYNPQITNVGNYILNQIEWIIKEFNQEEAGINASLVDDSAEPIPDESEPQVLNTDIYCNLPAIIDTEGDITIYRHILENIYQMHVLATCA